MRGAAIVTGASGGIGRGIAKSLADAGFSLVLTDLYSSDQLVSITETFDQNGVPWVFIKGDVDDDVLQDSLLEAPSKLNSPLTVLVNNAGVSSTVRGDPLDLPSESLDRALKVNLRAPFRLSQKVARRMISEGNAESTRLPRTIINITSVNATIVGMNRPDYCVTKAGLSMMSSVFAARLAGEGVKVFEIRPGITATEMTVPSKAKYDALMEDGTVPMRRWGNPSDIGQTVAILATNMLPFSTGDALHVDGGLHIYRV